MRGYVFYLEHSTPAAKRKREHSGNVLAVCYPFEIFAGSVEALVGVYDWPNSAICGGCTDRAYLAKYCRRVSEAEARRVHPAMFDHLAEVARGEAYRAGLDNGLSVLAARDAGSRAAARVRNKE